jgi:hypothetical protein
MSVAVNELAASSTAFCRSASVQAPLLVVLMCFGSSACSHNVRVWCRCSQRSHLALRGTFGSYICRRQFWAVGGGGGGGATWGVRCSGPRGPSHRRCERRCWRCLLVFPKGGARKCVVGLYSPVVVVKILLRRARPEQVSPEKYVVDQ